MDIERRILALENQRSSAEDPFVLVTLTDGRNGAMLWTEAMLAAIDGKIATVNVNDEGNLAALVRVMME